MRKSTRFVVKRLAYVHNICILGNIVGIKAHLHRKRTANSLSKSMHCTMHIAHSQETGLLANRMVKVCACLLYQKNNPNINEQHDQHVLNC